MRGGGPFCIIQLIIKSLIYDVYDMCVMYDMYAIDLRTHIHMYVMYAMCGMHVMQASWRGG